MWAVSPTGAGTASIPVWEWCACFVSWCYGQMGLSEPRFAACQSQGIPWFQSHGQWGGRDYANIAPGDAIFFDWDLDGSADHVGLVVGTDGSRVYTVEGNSGDACKIKKLFPVLRVHQGLRPDELVKRFLRKGVIEMAKNKIQRIDQEIAKVREKIAEYQDKLKTLEAQKTEAENLEIVQMVRALRLTPSS